MLRKEVSAGGVVVYRNTILLLKRFNDDWVLPKGRIEDGETLKETALREVFEETGVKGTIRVYLGEIEYRYRNIISESLIDKKVHWYLMYANNTNTVPQRNEGFKDAVFIHKDKVVDILRHDDEKEIIKKALLYID